MRLVLATSQNLPDLDPDDQLLVPALQKLGFQVDIQIWDDPTVQWDNYEACIIRSTWDYVPKRNDYIAWVKRVSQQTPIWNSPEVIEWNTDKTYLRELEYKGIRVVPTIWTKAGDLLNPEQLMQEHNWSSIVVKPVVSASGLDTYHVTQDNLVSLQPELERLAKERHLMIQPYFKSVEIQGEISLLFFNGKFSHAVQKLPSSGEFRIQVQFGGRYQPFTPDANQLTFAQQILNAVPWPMLYARVDVMTGDDNQWYLGELEVTEPSMYLKLDAESPARFAKAIQALL